MNTPLPKSIVELRESPEELEHLYRENPNEFAAALPAARVIDRESITLRVWEARLFFKAEQSSIPSGRGEMSDGRAIWLLILLCAVSGTIAKLPDIFGWFDDNRFYERNVAFFFLPAVAAYFAFWRGLNWKRLIIIAVGFLIAAVAINLYPPLYESSSTVRFDRSDSIKLASLHLPFFLWALAGLAFAAERWRDVETRIAYLRLTGEAIVYFALIIITGGLMTGITMSLFGAIKIDIDQWYFRWVVVYGACAAPIVATHLGLVRTRAGSTIAPLIARIFSPLALVTLATYLFAMIVRRQSPYSDREFLMVFNGMLLAVLGISLLSVCERKPSRFFDMILCALLLIALAIDSVALTAIIYRLTSLGISPNRIATLGANILVFINLSGILLTFAPAAWRQFDANLSKKWIARFLSVYAIWAAIVVFGFPLVFHFR